MPIFKMDGGAISTSKKTMVEEERFDGKLVFRTNTTLPADEVVLRCEELWAT